MAKLMKKDIDVDGKYIVVNSKFISQEGRVIKRTKEQMFLLFKGDIVMVMSDVPNGKALAKCFIIDNDDTYSLNQRICCIRSKEFDTKYLYYQLNRNEHFLAFNNGENQSNLRKDDILDCPLIKPSMEEQRRMVAELDEAIQKINNAKSNIERNLNNTQELIEGYLYDMFKNPKKHWEIKQWGELCHFVRGPFGGSLKKSVFKEKGFVVYEQKHAIHDHFNQLRYFIDEDKFNEMKRFEVKAGDIIMSCSGVTLGRVAIIPDNIPRGIINQALLKLTPNKGVSVHFLKYWLRGKIFQDIIFKYSGGAAIPNVPSAKILKEIKIPFPKLEEQNKIVSEIETLERDTNLLIEKYQTKIEYLEELKVGIMKRAFGNELIEAE